MLHRLFRTVAISLSIVPLLLACAGGGGSSSSSDPNPAPVLMADCTGANCGAADSANYSGSGIGIWSYKNTTSAAVTLPVNISGVAGKEATIVYTNQGDAAVSMPSMTLAPALQIASDASLASLNSLRIRDPAPAKVLARREEFARQFKLIQTQSQTTRKQVYAPAQSWVVGDT